MMGMCDEALHEDLIVAVAILCPCKQAYKLFHGLQAMMIYISMA